MKRQGRATISIKEHRERETGEGAARGRKGTKERTALAEPKDRLSEFGASALGKHMEKRGREWNGARKSDEAKEQGRKEG